MPHVSIEEADNAFRAKLKRALVAIIRDAKNRTCSQCKHAFLTSAGQGHCTKYVNFDGSTLHIERANAVACRSGFEAES